MWSATQWRRRQSQEFHFQAVALEVAVLRVGEREVIPFNSTERERETKPTKKKDMAFTFLSGQHAGEKEEEGKGKERAEQAKRTQASQNSPYEMKWSYFFTNAKLRDTGLGLRLGLEWCRKT